ncbi:glycosyltransferase family 2 protein [Billgrantia desiderata]|uniref:glycosyltransferase family 2 protein n=1 Tax=Billgrantia desiderata TaxID=52021 RepID=UPI00089EDC40|nr:glycosyltransferase family A protein [Halomonas desiderata]SEG45360.1 Glycosyl transferase family 2 [Halomonas desiderata]
MTPLCTIIVPVYEHWNLIPTLLKCLQSQTLNQETFEVLLVDNGSTNFAPPPELPANTRILHCATPGSYAARNQALLAARGEWLIFTDADCLPRAEWLEALMRQADRLKGNDVVLAGAVEMKPSGAHPSIYEMYDLVKGIPQAWYVSRGYAVTANLAVPAELARRLGGFEAKRFSGGDSDFVRRAVAEGASLHYVAEAMVEHPARDSWAAIATKARRIKGGQLTAGTSRQRALWLFRTFTPPLLAWYRFLLKSRQPWLYRLMASILQVRLWAVEAHEALRLLFRSRAERR